eukprot:366510-Chlamydomonas_euryale.AAC.13
MHEGLLHHAVRTLKHRTRRERAQRALPAAAEGSCRGHTLSAGIESSESHPDDMKPQRKTQAVARTLTPMYFSDAFIPPPMASSASSTAAAAASPRRFCITSSPLPPGTSSANASRKCLATPWGGAGTQRWRVGAPHQGCGLAHCTNAYVMRQTAEQNRGVALLAACSVCPI